MSGTGVLNIVAGIVELSVPSYGLHLVRRFGTRHVGWFIVVAFVSLALVHLAQWQRYPGAPPPTLSSEVVYILASGLLLIGMGHLQTINAHRQTLEQSETPERSRTEDLAHEEVQDLTQAIEELRSEIARSLAQIKALKQSETEYRFLFEENPLPMCVVDLRSGRFLAVNDAAQRDYGYTPEEWSGLTASDLVPVSAVTALLHDLAQPCSSSSSVQIWQHRRKDGTTFEAQITACDVDFTNRAARLMLIQDLSAQRHREVAVSAAQKLRTLEHVAGGVARHLQNLQSLVAGMRQLLASTKNGTLPKEQLEHVAAAVNDAAGVTGQLLAVAGRSNFDPEVLDLNALLERLRPALSSSLGEGISLQRTYRAKTAPILADPQLVENIIINLVRNAHAAMPLGGVLELSTAFVHIEKHSPSAPSIQGTEFVRLSVQDTGCGIPHQIQSRIFEPFFSTRDHGNGVGLGLATAYGLARQQGGWIEFSSQPGVGTEFRVFFPAAAEKHA
jgi:PAS domain S-box-containing protein